MRKLDVRRGIIGGGVVALIGAAGVASRSPDHLLTFTAVLAFALACAAAVIGVTVALSRLSKPPGDV